MVNSMSLQYRVFPDLAALSWAAALEVAQQARAAVDKCGRFTLALSGGRTPEQLYRLLAGPLRDEVPWAAVHLFWGDERWVPPDDPSSNFRMAYQAFISQVPIPPEHVHPMVTHLTDPADAARQYEQVLKRVLGAQGPALDLVLLGMGADGHTASLFPGTAAAAEHERWVVPVQAQVDPPLRLSLTRRVLEAAQHLLLLGAGEDKRPVWHAIQTDLNGSRQRYPAAMVGSGANAI